MCQMVYPKLFPISLVHIAFFISLKAAITSTGSVFPVFFWISGSYEQSGKSMNRVWVVEIYLHWLSWTHCAAMQLRQLERSNGDGLLTFSSPMVIFPWVCWCWFAYASSFLIGSDWDTVRQNLTLLLVYSWPGYTDQSLHQWELDS